MNDIYQLLRPVFTSETMTSAIRQAGLLRQSHLVAALRNDPPSATLALSTLKGQHIFMAALCQAFTEAKIPDEVSDSLGYHSFMFFGVNPRLLEIAILAVSGEEEYSLERLAEIMKAPVDTNELVRGEEYPVDTLRWMAHMGGNFANYLASMK